jgi:hypothetical protein
MKESCVFKEDARKREYKGVINTLKEDLGENKEYGSIELNFEEDLISMIAGATRAGDLSIRSFKNDWFWANDNLSSFIIRFTTKEDNNDVYHTFKFLSDASVTYKVNGSSYCIECSYCGAVYITKTGPVPSKTLVCKSLRIDTLDRFRLTLKNLCDNLN